MDEKDHYERNSASSGAVNSQDLTRQNKLLQAQYTIVDPWD
jgi:hypothetical protein